MQLPGPDYLAPAKLNLFLHVVGRRADGYHLLQSVFVLIDHCDRIRIRVRSDGVIARLNDVPGVPPEEDLAVRAARRLKEASGTPLGADLEVDKRIPMGGGLGGGSSDAATVLVALDRLWATNLGRGRAARPGHGARGRRALLPLRPIRVGRGHRRAAFSRRGGSALVPGAGAPRGRSRPPWFSPPRN